MKIGMFLFVFLFIHSITTAAQITPSEAVTKYVNVRSAPSSNSRIIAHLSPGERADVVNVVDDWYEVRLPNGVRGFVSKSWTRIIDEPINLDEVESIDSKGTVFDTILIEQFHILSDSVDKLSHDIDSLTKYMNGLKAESTRHILSKDAKRLLIITILAVMLAVIITYFITRLSYSHAKGGEKEPREEKLSRKSYLAASSPRIVQTQGTFCNLYVNFINTGDYPASSLRVNIYMIDTYVTKAGIYREFTFSTANPIASQKDVTFCEENIDFTDECTPKFVCIAIEYVDHAFKRIYQQEFTFKWEGVKRGQVREELEHVDKERSELVWIRIRELRFTKTKESRNKKE